MKKLMKKLGLLATVTALAVTSVFGLTACNGGQEVVYKTLDGAASENYGLCVAKSNTSLLAELNDFLGKQTTKDAIKVSLDYHSGASETTVEYPDLTDNTGKTITMCTEAGFAPYEYQKNSGVGVYKDKNGAGIAGLDVDVMVLFCESKGYKLEIDNKDFDGALQAVKDDTTGTKVGAAGITINETRKAEMGMTVPYVENVTQAIISLKENGFSTQVQLKGKTVGCQLGTSGNFTLTDWNDAEANFVQVKEYKQVMAAFQDMLNGKVDAVIIDDLVAKNLVANYGK